ncbi:hypothetical protein EVAR_13494_1 [Eumeta japonica]|uniref:Uncharacterized protein n=1 Tax=Eumeta variegata TaxID=151549 RepID=A0A4C1V001_EUMVA|nr:hypothetical protein EVAR_13494_1 [Eumeta japonica]
MIPTRVRSFTRTFRGDAAPHDLRTLDGLESRPRAKSNFNYPDKDGTGRRHHAERFCDSFFFSLFQLSACLGGNFVGNKGIYSSTVSRAMMSSAITPSLKSVPFFVEEFHRARKPAPLHCFLVHDQSSDD